MVMLPHVPPAFVGLSTSGVLSTRVLCGSGAVMPVRAQLEGAVTDAVSEPTSIIDSSSSSSSKC
jgi:hypothetical protein